MNFRTRGSSRTGSNPFSAAILSQSLNPSRAGILYTSLLKMSKNLWIVSGANSSKTLAIGGM